MKKPFLTFLIIIIAASFTFTFFNLTILHADTFCGSAFSCDTGNLCQGGTPVTCPSGFHCVTSGATWCGGQFCGDIWDCAEDAPPPNTCPAQCLPCDRVCGGGFQNCIASDCTTFIQVCNSQPCPGGFCGNGVQDTGEQCDGSDLAGLSCQALGYIGGTLSCNGGCGLNTDSCVGSNPGAVCGNGTIEAGEQCEGSNLNGGNCQNRGFTGGTLSCSSCQYNTSSCTGGTGGGGGACDTSFPNNQFHVCF